MDSERAQNVMLYVIEICNELVKKGALEGGKYQLSAEGKAHLATLKAEGFRPTETEMRQAVASLQREQMEHLE